jgi:uncharacterized membrane protein
MTQHDMSAPPKADAAPAFPVLRRIGFSDIGAALADGWRDVLRAPLMCMALGAMFALGFLLALACVLWLDKAYLAYPLAAGFVLIGPFAAAGLYEISRRVERREAPTWGGVARVMFAQSGREFAWLAFVSIFACVVWMYQVRLLLALFLGFRSFTSLPAFIDVVLTTREGLMFLAVGHVVGAVMATLVFSLTVISFPLLLDREVDFITAMIASVQSVLKSPGPMLLWAFIVVASLILAAAPFFLGLVLVLPTLGCATWRLYRRVVAPI